MESYTTALKVYWFVAWGKRLKSSWREPEDNFRLTFNDECHQGVKFLTRPRKDDPREET